MSKNYFPNYALAAVTLAFGLISQAAEVGTVAFSGKFDTAKATEIQPAYANFKLAVKAIYYPSNNIPLICTFFDQEHDLDQRPKNVSVVSSVDFVLQAYSTNAIPLRLPGICDYRLYYVNFNISGNGFSDGISPEVDLTSDGKGDGTPIERDPKFHCEIRSDISGLAPYLRCGALNAEGYEHLLLTLDTNSTAATVQNLDFSISVKAPTR